MPRETVHGFDYKKKSLERFEIPLNERIAAIRTRRAGERARHKENEESRGRSRIRPMGSAPKEGSQAGFAPEARRNSNIFGFSRGKGTSVRRSSMQDDRGRKQAPAPARPQGQG